MINVLIAGAGDHALSRGASVERHHGFTLAGTTDPNTEKLENMPRLCGLFMENVYSIITDAVRWVDEAIDVPLPNQCTAMGTRYRFRPPGEVQST